MIDVVIGLGSSLGDRAATLALAVHALAATRGVELVAVSRTWASAPLGPSDRLFLNAAVRLRSDAPPTALLARCQEIERRLGRRPARRWADRPIDLDLLLVAGEVRRDADLVLPHPGLATRAFALLPAREVAGEVRHPLLGSALRDLPVPLAPGCWRVGTLPRPRGRLAATGAFE